MIMGEKRAYKPRKPGGGRKKLKPEYDAGENLKEQMDAAVALYEEDCSLRSIADALTLNPIKVRKLLITAGVYESDVAEKVQDTFEDYRETQNYKEAILSTVNTLQLSKASVTSYLLYQKGVYFPSTADKEKISVGAKRRRRYRAVRKLRSEPTEEHLWETVLLYSGVRFKTYSGLPFTIEPTGRPSGDIEKSSGVCIPAYPLPMKYEKAGMASTQKSCGSTVGRRVKAWRGVRCFWHYVILKR